MYAVETHCLCELLNRYVIITKHAIVSALLFSQSEQKVKSGICTIEYKICTKGLRKKSLCVFNICENCTAKYPMAQAVFVKITQEKTPLYIYYIISTGANAACIILAFWYYVSVLNRVRATKKRGTERQQNEPDAMRRAFMLAVLPTLAQRGNTGQRIHCKGDEQTEICFQMCDCVRGYYGGLPAIRAHKVAQAAPMRARFQNVYDYQQLLPITRSAKNDKHEQQHRRRHREHRRHR